MLEIIMVFWFVLFLVCFGWGMDWNFEKILIIVVVERVLIIVVVFVGVDDGRFGGVL